MTDRGKWILIGVHLQREDIGVEGVAALAANALFVSGLPIAADASLAEPELLRKVATLRQRLMDEHTFVAVRYGSTIRSESELREKVAPHAERWRDLLERYRFHVEVTLKIAPTEKRDRPDAQAASSGADYLRKLHDSRRPQIDPAFRLAVEREFATADLRKWRNRSDGGVEFAALLKRADLARLPEAAEALRNEFPDTPFLISGPWPLEVFADE